MRTQFTAAACAALLLAGCTGLSERVDNNVNQTDTKASGLVRDVGRTAPAGVVGKVHPTVEHQTGIWLSKNVVKVSQPTLPPIFYEPATFDRTVHSLSELAERITLRSGIPTKVSPDALAASSGMAHAGGGANGGNVNAQGEPAVGLPTQSATHAGKSRGPVRISFANGNFKSLLDTVAARFGVYWKYANGTVQFYHTDSRTFQISAIPGDSSFSATVTSGATSSGGTGGSEGGAGSGVSANNTQNTGVKSQLSVYSSIEKAINAMLSSHGKVVASPATGTITVVDTPDTLDRVASFVESENLSLARQITINVTVLAVTLNQGDNYGIQWNLIYQGLLAKYGIANAVAAGSNATSFSAGILQSSNSKFAGSDLIVKALSEQGKVRRETTASVVTLNNQPVPVQVAKQTSYLKSSQTTTAGLAGTAITTLTPGTVTSGFNMSILPHILNNGTVMLQFTTDISALKGFRTVTSNNSSIETPEIDTRNFLQRVSMKSNETLIISGFEQTDDNLSQNGVGSPKNYLFGGGYNGSTNKEVIVILITPTTMLGS